MKQPIILLLQFSLFSLFGFSQNKKEQIEILNLRIDSCKTVISKQSTDLNTKQLKISELEQKLSEEHKISQEKSNQLTLLKKEIEALKSKIPAEANFKYKVVTQVENQDARAGADSEIEVYLMIQNQLVDTYSEFGDPELNPNKTYIDLSSEMSKTNYEIISVSSTKILVKRYFFCSDCEIQESQLEKVYQKDAAGIWKFMSCSGDCEDELINSNTPPSEKLFAQPKFDDALKMPAKLLIGTWEGEMNSKPLKIVIESIDGDWVYGYNVYAGNKRPIEGKIKGEGDWSETCTEALLLELNEPGSATGDGMFIVIFYAYYPDDETGEFACIENVNKLEPGGVTGKWMSFKNIKKYGFSQEMYFEKQAYELHLDFNE